MLPVIGLSFGNIKPSADPAAYKEVLKTLVDNGGRVFDAMHGDASSEQFHATIANELEIQNQLFWSTRGTPPGGPGGPPPPGAATAKAHIEMWLARLELPKIDLVMLPATADPTHFDGLKEAKKEGRVRYIGAQVIVDERYAQLESIMRNEPIDFIGVDYDITNRGVEQTILPLAQERKIGVMAFFPFGVGSLFKRADTTPLPEWAADFDAKTWAQFFLKYVIGHPAVTVARTGTSQAKHMLDNIGGGIGRLPNEATRKRMVELVDAWPPAGPR
ncbi:MAG: aldo/keto reductase [Planctomycetota bacterium]